MYLSDRNNDPEFIENMKKEATNCLMKAMKEHINPNYSQQEEYERGLIDEDTYN